MNEKDFTEDDIPEPEGFWPEDDQPADEPYEVIPYTPDAPEFTWRPEPPPDLDRPEPPPPSIAKPDGAPPIEDIHVTQPMTYAWDTEPRQPLEQPQDNGGYSPVTSDPWLDRQTASGDPFSADRFAGKMPDDFWVSEPSADDPNAPQYYTPASTDETMRRSGLAWSAGIAFFGSVAFMLFLGWLADLLLGTAPWGMVGGIVFGSIIGFIQFFRISSQIYGTSKNDQDFRPLLSRDNTSDTPEQDPEQEPPL